MKITRTIALCSLLIAFSFLGGIFIGASRYFPYEYLAATFEQFENNSLEQEIPTQLNNDINVTSLIHIHSSDDVSEKRTNLIKYIWKQNNLSYDKMPSKIEKGIIDQSYDDLINLSRIDRITTNMEYGVNSISYLFLADNGNNKLVIYHQGHDGDFKLGKNTIKYFLESGYSVLAFSMPLVGMNNQPIVSLPNFGKIKLETHDDFKFIETNDFSPIKFFVDPILVSINYIDKEYDFDSYYMVGLSGGGWTTVLYSALDSRITKSYPIAATAPMYLRFNNPKNIGDYEQTLPSMYNIANYLDLYIMGSYGEGRSQLQIFNEYDPCCFSGTGFMTYKNEVKNTVAKLGEGKFDVFLDSNNKKHSVSDESLQTIMHDIEN